MDTPANPYVGPRAFAEEDRGSFFGRDREIRELHALAVSRRAVLLYAPSGAGKTSLLHAGLLPALREIPGAGCLPVARVSGDPPAGLGVANLYVFNLLSFLIGDHTEPRELASLSLREGLAMAVASRKCLARNPHPPTPSPISLPPYPGRGGATTQRPEIKEGGGSPSPGGGWVEDGRGGQGVRTPSGTGPIFETPSDEDAPDILFLTIDQGEEIFSFAPHRFAERKVFFQQLREALDACPGVTLILALREDWLAHLDPHLDLLPDRMRTRFRLELLGREEALRAVAEPALRAGVTFAPEAANALVDDLRRLRVQAADGSREEVPGLYVDPVQLQVVCRRLWERRPPGATEIGPADVEALGSVDRALAGYYAAEVAEAAGCAGIPEQAVRRWIGRQLITSGGLRGQVLRETGTTLGLDDLAVQSLIAAHLVRAERRRGAVWLELAHDRLIEPVRSDNEAWEEAHLSPLEREADAWERAGRPAGRVLTGESLAQAERQAASHAAELSPVEIDFLAACRRERSHGRARRLAVMTSFLLVVAVILTLFAVRDQRAARHQALVQGLVAQARLFQRDDLDLALLLAVEANRRSEAATDALTSQALFEGLTASPSLITLLHGGQGNVLGLAFHPRGRLLAAALDDGTVQLWDLVAERPAGPPLPASDGRLWSVAWSPDGRLLAAAGDQALLLWSSFPAPSRPRRLAIDPAGELDAYAVAFSPDGLTLAAATSDNDVRRWDVATEASLDPPLKGPTDWVTSLAWSPDGHLLAAGAMDHKIHLWDARTGRSLWDPADRHTEGIYSVAFSPDGHLLASASHDGTVILWETATGRRQGWPLRVGDDLATAVAWSPDGRRLALGSKRGTIDLWDAVAERPAASSRTLAKGDLRSLAFAPDGRTLASGHGSTIALWSLEPSVPLGSAIHLSPAELRLWRQRAGSPRGEPPLPPHIPGDRIKARAWSPDGRQLATADRDRRIFLWTADTGELLAGPFTGHTEEIVGLAFAPGGQALDSADREGTRIRWDVDLASWRGRACRMAHRGLTREEWQTFLPGIPYAPACSSHPV